MNWVKVKLETTNSENSKLTRKETRIVEYKISHQSAKIEKQMEQSEKVKDGKSRKKRIDLETFDKGNKKREEQKVIRVLLSCRVSQGIILESTTVLVLRQMSFFF